MLPPLSIAPPEGAARAAAAKIWLASQSLPQQTRASVTSVIDAVSDTKLKAAAGGVRSLLDGARAHLDPASIQELETLASELSQPPG
jgi:hypothetical protein